MAWRALSSDWSSVSDTPTATASDTVVLVPVSMRCAASSSGKRALSSAGSCLASNTMRKRPLS